MLKSVTGVLATTDSNKSENIANRLSKTTQMYLNGAKLDSPVTTEYESYPADLFLSLDSTVMG